MRFLACRDGIPSFPPTKIAEDINGNTIYNEEGSPLKVPNEQYVWKKLDDKIAALTDLKVQEQLRKDDPLKLAQNQEEATRLKKLKVAVVDGR